MKKIFISVIFATKAQTALEYINEVHKHRYNNEHDSQKQTFYAVTLTCVEGEGAAAHSGSAGWPSGSCGDGQRTWGKVWGFPLSPRCLLRPP